MAICVLCEEKELAPNSRLTTCSNCRASMSVWGRRTSAEVLIRRRKLHIYDMRMEMVVLHPDNPRRAIPDPKPFISATALRKMKRASKKGVNSNGRARAEA